MLEESMPIEMHDMEICITSDQLPEIKNWKPGKEYKIPVRMRSIETDEKGKVKGEFVVKGSSAEKPSEEPKTNNEDGDTYND